MSIPKVTGWSVISSGNALKANITLNPLPFGEGLSSNLQTPIKCVKKIQINEKDYKHG